MLPLFQSARVVATILLWTFAAVLAHAEIQCPLCGCAQGHCAAGVEKHLACSQQSASERAKIAQRLAKQQAAMEKAKEMPTTHCSEFASFLAAQYGYRGLYLSGT